MRRLSLSLLLIPALVMGVPMVAQAQVYQWKDAQGTVHFSDTPPKHGIAYKSVQVDAGPDGVTATPVNPAADNQDDAADANTDKRKPNTPQNRKDLCSNLSANIKVLQNPAPVITTGSSGKAEVMTAGQRSSELAREQKQYQQFCSG